MRFFERVWITSMILIYTLILPANVLSENTQANQPGDSELPRLEHYQGQVVLVSFWASWCNPCEQTFGWMNQLQSQYKNQDLHILAINLDTSQDKAEAFLEKNPAQFNIIYDTEKEFADQFHLTAMPNSFLINQSGEVVYNLKGFNKKDMHLVEEKIHQLTREAMHVAAQL